MLYGTLICLVLAGAAWSESSQGSRAVLPARLESYLATSVRLTAADRRRLTDGAPITKMLDVDVRKEVSALGAIWINAPMGRYVEALNGIEQFERGKGFGVTKRISVPPRLEDFAQLHLPAEDVADLPSCRIGDCALKLDEQAIKAFHTEVNWQASGAHAAADAVMRRVALAYVRSYLEGGNQRLPVYRDDIQPTVVADEFRKMVDQMPSLTNYLPDLRRHLLDYPSAPLPGSTSFLYWQETEFGLKRTIRISHLAIRERSEETVVASKMLYATHYFLAAIELRVLIPDPSRGSGFWFVTINRTRLDGLSGFTGFFVRQRVRSGVYDGMLNMLRMAKTRLERTRP